MKRKETKHEPFFTPAEDFPPDLFSKKDPIIFGFKVLLVLGFIVRIIIMIYDYNHW